MRALSWGEQKQDWGGLKTELQQISALYNMSQFLGCIYRNKDITSVHKVQAAEDQTGLGVLIALGPALCQNIVLGLKLCAQCAGKTCVNGCQKNCGSVVAGGRGQCPVLGL